MLPRLISRFFLICLFGASAPSGDLPGAAPPLSEILDRMSRTRAENRARFRPYTVTREYKLFGKDRENPRSRVVVDVSFDPPGRKTFSIHPESRGGLGERIVRQMLDGEIDRAGPDLSGSRRRE
jgi:hypothetical protein